MGLFSGLFRSRDKPQNRTTGSSYAFFMGGSTAGKAVNERSAMQMTAVYACVRILSEAIAGLPLHLYEYGCDGSKEKAVEHPLYFLLHDEPNKEMTSFVFRETLMTHLLLWGNAYAQVIRNGKGEVIALYPLMPNRMEVMLRFDIRTGLDIFDLPEKFRRDLIHRVPCVNGKIKTVQQTAQLDKRLFLHQRFPTGKSHLPVDRFFFQKCCQFFRGHFRSFCNIPCGRILAARAMQIAPLEENHRAYTRTVHQTAVKFDGIDIHFAHAATPSLKYACISIVISASRRTIFA